MERAQIEGFISLLQDDSERIQRELLRQARALGPSGAGILREAMQREDPTIAARAEALLHEIQIPNAWSALLTEASSESPDIFRFQAALSELEDPRADRSAMTSCLHAFAEAVRSALQPGMSPSRAAEALRLVLHHEAGLIGATRDYYDPRNSILSLVLRRRVGIPISLATVYLLVGRAAGLELYGVGMPFHFLVGLKVGDESLLLDPFRKGRITTREDCRIMLAGFDQAFRDDYLRPVSDRELLLRTMANLLRIHLQSEDESRAARCRILIERLQAPLP